MGAISRRTRVSCRPRTSDGAPNCEEPNLEGNLEGNLGAPSGEPVSPHFCPCRDGGPRPGARSKEPGARSQEQGARSKEQGARPIPANRIVYLDNLFTRRSQKSHPSAPSIGPPGLATPMEAVPGKRAWFARPRPAAKSIRSFQARPESAVRAGLYSRRPG
jgi:hypothetical protein